MGCLKLFLGKPHRGFHCSSPFSRHSLLLWLGRRAVTSFSVVFLMTYQWVWNTCSLLFPFVVIVSSADSPSRSRDQLLLTCFASLGCSICSALQRAARPQLCSCWPHSCKPICAVLWRGVPSVLLPALCRHLNSRSLMVLSRSSGMWVRIRDATGKEMYCENAVPD